MTKYHLLRIYSYQHPGQPIDNELNKRFKGYGTIKFPLAINPIDVHEQIRIPTQLPLFLVQIEDYNSLLTVIRENSAQIKAFIGKLPDVAREQFFIDLLIKEIKGTNDIENVAATIQEINRAVENINNHNKTVRFQSFAKMYFDIENGKTYQLNELKDIRILYDSLLKGEIAKSNLPDGKLFRDGFVRLGNSVQTVHLPKNSEDEINQQLKNWLKFINLDKYDPILKACVVHYYFEYIHPFYDGNGRLGRYLFCSYIGKKVDPYTAVSFSYQINQKKARYYKEFQEVENEKNYGEITLFVISLLKYLVSGQKYVLGNLKDDHNILNFVKKKLEDLDYLNFEFNILYVYAQSFLFNSFDGSVQDTSLISFIKSTEKISTKKVKTAIEDLEKEGLIKTVKGRPKKRKLTAKFLDKIGLNI
ncbi:Fic family protein [Lactobacillus sp. M0398]|uniref:Fic family protein n=1 Tax=unclassified Lactobacillus TaxID=2620435 RepID=UPI0018DD59B4|nr:MULTISPECIES: Fic family protein [unclassified Lactobacillus]MBI0120812.1 Fic family protein [Lactobacillus sp. M0398]MBI0122720.1 Fic family protein [Lactobacillus sp. W8174]MBI0135129.1 Fic family protein [Lactobacillus sp. W8173]